MTFIIHFKSVPWSLWVCKYLNHFLKIGPWPKHLQTFQVIAISDPQVKLHVLPWFNQCRTCTNIFFKSFLSFWMCLTSNNLIGYQNFQPFKPNMDTKWILASVFDDDFTSIYLRSKTPTVFFFKFGTKRKKLIMYG